MPTITLLTDFGLTDTFVGVMKGVMLSVCPGATLVDLTHAVPPQDVAAGARALLQAVPFFPRGTVHVAVVDPGVGTARRGLAVGFDGGFLVGPDNGLLAPAMDVLGAVEVVVLDNAAFHLPVVSSTFHGRDVFAPVAAHLARGVPLRALGTPASSWVRLALPQPGQVGSALVGQVVAVDAFGNLVTNLRAEQVQRLARPVFHVASMRVEGLSATFGSVSAGKGVAYVGSDGVVELAVNRGHAARVWGVKAGDAVKVTEG
jgi:S-adenosylmethionine hydrolase